ncbi:MAG: XdhC family protein [Anaerolineae bacterium]
METIYTQLADLLAAGETVAVATIIDVKGSVPREVGAKMIIHPLGRHVGTVGGGCGEAEVIKAGLDVIQTGTPTIVRVDLTEEVSMQALGVCGGIMDVFVERVEGRQASNVMSLLESIRAREAVALATVVSGPSAGRQAVIWLDRPPLGELGLGELEPRVIADAQKVLAERRHRLLRYVMRQDVIRQNVIRQDLLTHDALTHDAPTHDALTHDALTHDVLTHDALTHDVFVEVQRRAPELLIVGAGHIAVPLAQIAALCDFAVTVLDDRASFADPNRFPTARRVIAAPLRETLRDLPIDADTYIVLVTRGHSHDVECLLEVLDRPAAYIGMIGSQRRVDAVFKLLAEEQGIDPTRFDRVYAPIGLDIGAHTPAEIAVCIMAEIINIYRGGPAVSLSDKRRARDRQRREKKSE